MDKHLNLFYTYNRDTELVENNLTRAFVVFLSIVSDEARHRIMSALLEKAHSTASVENPDFANACFALQSNIARELPRDAARKLLLTVATEPLDVDFGAPTMDPELTEESASGSASVPDAWVYDGDGAYCVLIEAKVGSYPLNVNQLQAHAMDWFGSSLETLRSQDLLCSITWVDVLETLKDTSSDDAHADVLERTLVFHMMEFINYYGYQSFEGLNFGSLNAPPSLILGGPAALDRGAVDPGFHRLAPPPGFMLAYQPCGSSGGVLGE